MADTPLVSTKAGRFIALEGGEGVGKSTQAGMLVERLRAAGHTVVSTREPGGTNGAEAIRELLLHRTPSDGWTVEAEALLFAAARADHVARLIRPALARGEWVVCDRYLGSSLAYQGAAGGLGEEAVRSLHTVGSGGLMPDATLVLRLDGGHERATARDGGGGDAIGGRSATYHAAVAEAFTRSATDRRSAAIDASGPPGLVAERVDAALDRLLA